MQVSSPQSTRSITFAIIKAINFEYSVVPMGPTSIWVKLPNTDVRSASGGIGLPQIGHHFRIRHKWRHQKLERVIVMFNNNFTSTFTIAIRHPTLRNKIRKIGLISRGQVGLKTITKKIPMGLTKLLIELSVAKYDLSIAPKQKGWLLQHLNKSYKPAILTETHSSQSNVPQNECIDVEVLRLR